MRNIPELLAPAGTLEVLRAAVDAGADAVYFGGKAFNARAGAGNFTLEEIREAVRYARLRNVRTYLTLNTLVKDSQWAELETFVRDVIGCGISGMITTDMGVIAWIRKHFPDFPIHGSTQMNIHDLPGAEYVRELGLSRVVLARELSLKDIRHISAHAGIETEVFVHGALCCSYSGRCLMSSFIGGRSGNRGRCAQSCRLPWIPEGEKSEQYCFNLKDMCAIRHLKELSETGTASLKIEGRLKSAAYVAGVTRLYRKALDYYRRTGENYPVSDDEMNELQLLFNRGGFSEGYLFGKKTEMICEKSPKHTGIAIGEVLSVKGKAARIRIRRNESLSPIPGDTFEVVLPHPPYPSFILRKEDILTENASEMVIRTYGLEQIHAKDPVNWLISRALTEDIQKQLLQDPKRIAVDLFLTMKNAELPVLKASARVFDESFDVTVCGKQPVEKAQSRPLTSADAEKQLRKTGGSDFEAVNVAINMDPDVFMPVSMLNALRRSALDQLSEKISRPPVYRETAVPEERKYPEAQHVQMQSSAGQPAWYALVSDRSQAEACLGKLDGMWLRMEKFSRRDLSELRAEMQQRKEKDPSCHETKIGIALPLIARAESVFGTEALQMELNQWKEAGITEMLVHHPGQLEMARSMGIPVWCSGNIAVMNQKTGAHLEACGAGITLSSELSLQEWKSFHAGSRCALPVYGRAEAMVTEQRIVPERSHWICDRKNEIWPVEQMKTGYQIVYTPRPVNASRNAEQLCSCTAGRWIFRFTTENAEECLDVVEQFTNARKGVSSSAAEVYWIHKGVE